jgi:hypothetical protein
MSESNRLKGIPIGIDDFRKLMERDCFFVDKSLFIKEILDDPAEVKLITRPRRFGKTLNLSMLRYYLEKTAVDYGFLFQDLKIWEQGQAYISEQGQYPVVNLTFKDIKYRNFNDCLENIKKIIGVEFRRHKYILGSAEIDEVDREEFEEIKNEKAGYVSLNTSLALLTRLLREYHKKEVIVLIDEYDTPINQGYLSGFYEDIIDFMRNFLGGGLKGNSALKTAVITGIYRMAKESIFSEFNNLEVCSVTKNLFADKFGFTESEVEEMLLYFNMKIKINEVKEWYNGYIFGDNTVIYNPWSILNYVKSGKLEPYWVNTSSNDLIREILRKTDPIVKKKLPVLMGGQELKGVTINTDINFRDIRNKEVISEEVLWNLLLVSGYLKPIGLHYNEYGDAVCDLKIPNKEILKMYRDIFAGWFGEGEITSGKIKELLYHLVEGEVEEFRKGFEYLVQKTFSYFDVGENAAENFYHAFILGLLVNLDGRYRVKSNTESGKGRPDVIIIPADKNKKGVIMEFKTSDREEDAALQEKAREALEQIEKMNYAAELVHAEIKEALELAIVFYRKKTYLEFKIRPL